MAEQRMVDPAIFEFLQSKIDDDTAFRDKLRDIVQVLEKQTRAAQASLSRAHSTPTSSLSPTVLSSTQAAIEEEIKTITELSQLASAQPYYKWNNTWSRTVQDAIFTVLYYVWLGGSPNATEAGRLGRLLTLEEVGQVFQTPTNLKDRDAFHITIEEYLLSLINLIDELSRLARTSVTLHNYALPLMISQFIKDIHAGFQVLNLKNDILRKRSDGIKYRVREVEDVVYDLSLRGLIPKAED